mmetsp:Transcript_63756/g.73094  ORF Transcript_63756/g.73094 Transcript_63756/m.73094 type:complete len:155 (-) Transcript_63756:572-1036(-)
MAEKWGEEDREETSIRGRSPEEEKKEKQDEKTSQRTSRILMSLTSRTQVKEQKQNKLRELRRQIKEKSIEPRWFFTHTHTYISRSQWKYLKQTKRNGGGEEGKIKKRRTKLFCSKKSINLEMRERERISKVPPLQTITHLSCTVSLNKIGIPKV